VTLEIWLAIVAVVFVILVAITVWKDSEIGILAMLLWVVIALFGGVMTMGSEENGGTTVTVETEGEGHGNPGLHAKPN